MTPIIALHGFLGRPQFWQPFREALDVYYNFPFYTPDLYDPRFFTEPSWSEWPRQFKEWLDYEEIDPPFVLLGYSMGGRLALDYAIRNPSFVSHLVLFSTRPAAPEGEELLLRREWELQWISRFTGEPVESWWKSWNQLDVFQGGQPSLPPPYDLIPEQIAQSMQGWSVTTQDLNWSHLINLQCPQLWCFGEKDQKYLGYAQQVRDRVPDVKVFEIENAGHRIPIENPGSLGYRVAEFMGFPTK